MSFSGAKQTSTTSQAANTSPWQPAQGALQGILSGAQDWMSNAENRQPYMGQTFAPMSSNTQAGMDALARGGQNTGAAQGYYGDALSGKFADAGNPYFQQMADSVKAQVMPSVNATFSRAGMTGATPHQYTLTNALSNAIAPLAYDNYRQGLGMMQDAASAAPQLDATRAQQQIAAGQLGESYTQKGIDQEMARYYEQQNRPLLAMQQASGIINPIAGMGSQSQSSGTTTQQTQQSPLQTALGLGMMGASMFGTGGMFPGAGGALAGMFGGGSSGMASPLSWMPTVMRN